MINERVKSGFQSYYDSVERPFCDGQSLQVRTVSIVLE